MARPMLPTMSKLLIFFQLVRLMSCWTYEDEFNYRRKALESYDRDIRPLKNQSEAMNVNVFLSIDSLTQFDVFHGQLKMESYLLLDWIDEKLRWNESLYQISIMNLPTNKIWSPSVCVSSTTSQVSTQEYPQVYLYSNGSVNQWRRIYVAIRCNVNAYAFPFDSHNCETMLYFSDYDILTARFNRITCKRTGDLPDSNWYVELSCEIGHIYNSSRVMVSIKLARKVQLQCLFTLIPLLIFFILNIMAGYLPIQSGEKVTFATTVFLSNVVYLGDLNKQLPQEPKVIPLIFLCHITLTFLSGMSAVGSILSSKIFWRGRSSQAVAPSESPRNRTRLNVLNPEKKLHKDDLNKDFKSPQLDDFSKRQKSFCCSKIESIMSCGMTFISILFASIYIGLYIRALTK